METIYMWVRSFVFYLIFMTLLLNLLPDRKYERYLRLFAGLVLILLVFSPFTDLAGLEERLAGSVERLTLQNDVRLLRRDLQEADKERLSKLLKGYQDLVETDLRTMTEGGGLQCLEAEAELLETGEDGAFGGLSGVRLRVGFPKTAAAEETEVFSQAAADGGERASGLSDKRKLTANREIAQLKKKIGEYYGLEEGQITIDLETE